ncbi:MAG TPA: hypothetical protein VIH35_03020 [Kiritimatiellia bacterium]
MIYKRLALLAVLAVAAVLSGCSDKRTWYDDTREGADDRDARVESHMNAGLDEVEAKRAVDSQNMVNNTERPPPPPPGEIEKLRALE